MKVTPKSQRVMGPLQHSNGRVGILNGPLSAFGKQQSSSAFGKTKIIKDIRQFCRN